MAYTSLDGEVRLRSLREHLGEDAIGHCEALCCSLSTELGRDTFWVTESLIRMGILSDTLEWLLEADVHCNQERNEGKAEAPPCESERHCLTCGQGDGRQ